MFRTTDHAVRFLLVAFVLTSGLWGATATQADHRHVGVHVHGGWSGWDYSLRPQCVTNWYGPGVYNSGFYGGPGWYGGSGGGYQPYYAVSGTLSTAPWGGVYSTNYSSFGFSPWGPYYGQGFGLGYARQTIVANTQPVVIVNSPTTAVRGARASAVLPRSPAGPDVHDILQQHAERRENVPAEIDEANIIRPVSGSSRSGKDRSKLFQAEGDRWLKDGQLTKAYLRYLEAQREADDRADIYVRQAFALVAMGRYSHAVLKLKRGIQIDPTVAKSGEDLDAIYGVENVVEKTEYLQRVADWTNAGVRDPDRLFLMGVMLHFDNDPRSVEFFQAAWAMSGKGQHLQAFLKPADIPVANRVRAAAEVVARPARRELPPPPQPQDDPIIVPHNVARGPKLPKLDVPPQPAPRQLILPDVYLPEENQ